MSELTEIRTQLNETQAELEEKETRLHETETELKAKESRLQESETVCNRTKQELNAVSEALNSNRFELEGKRRHDTVSRWDVLYTPPYLNKLFTRQLYDQLTNSWTMMGNSNS